MLIEAPSAPLPLPPSPTDTNKLTQNANLDSMPFFFDLFLFYLYCCCFCFERQLPKVNERNLDKQLPGSVGGEHPLREGLRAVNDINVERQNAHKNLHMDEVRAGSCELRSLIANPHPHPHLEIITQRSNGHWPASACASCPSFYIAVSICICKPICACICICICKRICICICCCCRCCCWWVARKQPRHLSACVGAAYAKLFMKTAKTLILLALSAINRCPPLYPTVPLPAPAAAGSALPMLIIGCRRVLWTFRIYLHTRATRAFNYLSW